MFHTSLATVSWSWGTSGILRGALAGEVDATNRDDVLGEVRERLHGPGVRAAHLDAARLTFCDARALAGLAEVACSARAAGLHLEVTNLASHLVRLLDLLGAERPGPDRR